MNILQGLQKLGFEVYTDFILQDDGDGVVYISKWKSDQAQPSEADITLADAQAQAEYDSKQYARDRAEAYPSLAEQADMAYWDRQNNTTTLDDAISAVKTTYPKPGV
mgnify:CR=1 FL=1